MEHFVIEGGRRLSGRVRPDGNKNEALPLLAATLLSEEPVTLRRVPRILDVEAMLGLLRSVGAEADWTGPDVVTVWARRVDAARLDEALCREIRASILLAGPLLARCGRVTLPPPGGDVIGRRRLDTHFNGLQALGAEVHVNRSYRFEARSLSGADIFLDEASVTATENIVSAAVLARGTTVIRNAACEPHVRNLCRVLVAMGARIEGVGTNTVTIHGIGGATTGDTRLRGGDFTVGPDYLEIGSWIGAAAVTLGEIEIDEVDPDDLRMTQLVFHKLGIELPIEDGVLWVRPDQTLRVRTDYHNEIPRISSAPWPAFPTDLMSIAITVATQCHGESLFFEKMFDGRMVFVDHLVAMGARILVCDPHRVLAMGPSTLFGTELKSPDIRAGMALLTACLCARGRSTLYNVRQIDRGYARVDEKLRALGAAIERREE